MTLVHIFVGTTFSNVKKKKTFSKTILKQFQKNNHGRNVLFSVPWRVRGSSSSLVTAINQLCGPSRLTASVLVRSPVRCRVGGRCSPSGGSSERRVCLWQFTPSNIAWTNHQSVVVSSFMTRAGRGKFSKKMVFAPKEWQASPFTASSLFNLVIYLRS